MKPKLISTSELARRLGCTTTRVRQRAASRGIEAADTSRRESLWREEDVERLRPLPPGNPAWREAKAAREAAR